MAYSDYGAFVHRDGERRRDKEDVGVYDTDEASLPSGARIYANILKRGADVREYPWWKHSQHGVMGDGPVRVACYKQGLPSGGIWYWPEGADQPVRYIAQDWTPTPPLPRPEGDYPAYKDTSPEAVMARMAWSDYHESLWDYDYGTFRVEHDFGTGLYVFTFTDKKHNPQRHYSASMTEPDGTFWTCVYDSMYGAGLTEYDPLKDR